MQIHCNYKSRSLRMGYVHIYVTQPKSGVGKTAFCTFWAQKWGIPNTAIRQ